MLDFIVDMMGDIAEIFLARWINTIAAKFKGKK